MAGEAFAFLHLEQAPGQVVPLVYMAPMLGQWTNEFVYRDCHT